MALLGEQIPDYVKNQIKVRQASYGSGISSDLLRTDETLLYANARNAFIKMASGVSISEDKLKEIGFSNAQDLTDLKGMGLAKKYVLFGGISEMGLSQGGNGVLKQKTEFFGPNGAYSALSNDFGIVPMPGIESLDVKSLNRGSLKKATVKLTAQTRDQLAILDVLYMRLGYTVLIEWGNSIYLASENRTTPEGDRIEYGRLQQMYTSLIEDNNGWFNSAYGTDKSYSDITTQIAKVRELYNGNFDALLGKVSNFNWSFNPDGSYSVELTIISLGDIVESLKTNVPAAYNTLKYVNNNGTAWATEDDTLDQHRKDNIVLSLLHTLRVLNQNPTGTPLTIETGGQQTAYPGKLLTIGGSTITYGDHTLTITTTVGFKDKKSGEFVGSFPALVEGYYDAVGGVIDEEEAIRLAKLSPGRSKDFFKGYGYGIPLAGTQTSKAKAVFNNDFTTRTFTISKTFSQAEWEAYQTSGDDQIGQEYTGKQITNPDNPVSKWRKEIFDKIQVSISLKEDSKIPSDGGDQTITPINFFNNAFQRTILDELKSGTSETYEASGLTFDSKSIKSSATSNTQTISNPLKGTGYEEQDAFALNLDKPQYYIRFGYLLNLLKKKVITKINLTRANYDDKPGLFNIDTGFSPMCCLPLQISFDWRTCIVPRENFNRENSWKQNIFKQLKPWQDTSKSNTADAMKIYLNFNFIAESMTSNSDDRGNISVYDFIKSMCDGINKALAGVNNLEPIIDEDSNTLRIFDSTPIPRESTNPGYKLQLYGYGNGVTNPKDSSTFVRKVDLKTAITPEYATMITVGATANGYVKGTEATAFARWNDGLTDRFKTELVAADVETQQNGVKNDAEDTAASFQSAMNWTARCFGIEGAGKIWECFPNK
jgi:hypothetical protein